MYWKNLLNKGKIFNVSILTLSNNVNISWGHFLPDYNPKSRQTNWNYIFNQSFLIITHTIHTDWIREKKPTISLFSFLFLNQIGKTDFISTYST